MRKIVSGVVILFLACMCAGSVATQILAATKPSVKEVSISQSDGDFVYGVSSTKVSFKITKKCKQATVYIIDEEGNKVYKKVISKIKGNKTYSLTWNGKESSGDVASTGIYKAMVVVGKSTMTSTNGVLFYATSDFSKGNGSESNPYEVANAEQLKAVSKHNGRSFVLTQDIDCAGVSYVTLFSAEDQFSGSFDGQGHTIKNISISGSSERVGLFRQTTSSAVIQNVNLSDCMISGGKWVAALVGANSGTIKNCSVTNCVVNGSSIDVGALTGYNGGKILSCTTTGNTISGGDDYVGSMAGYLDSTGYVSECKSSQDIISCKDYDCGGICGYSKGTIMRCEVKDDTIGGDWGIGGIAGKNEGTIANCVVYDESGLIKGGSAVHGIAGSDQGTSSNNSYYGELS